MTEPTDLPPADDDGDAADAADARWFREAVGPVVDARPVPHAWDAIRARATGEGPTVVALRPAGDGAPRRGRRLALLAACLLLLGGLGVALAVDRDGKSEPQTVTATTTPAPSDATGWYVPRGLPDGWELESVETDWLDIEGYGGACPCRSTVWASDRSVLIHAVADQVEADDGDGSGSTEVDLGGGVTGHLASLGTAIHVLGWEQGGDAHGLWARGVDEDEIVAAGRRLVDDPDAPPGEDLREVASQQVPAAVLGNQSVLVRLSHPERGIGLTYQLVPSGLGFDVYLFGVPTTVEIPGQPLPVDRLEPFPGDEAEGGHLYQGRWPGADVTLGSVDDLAEGPVTDDDVRALIAALRPATAEEWRAFLDTATGTVEEEARADAIADLVVARDGDPGDPSSDDPSDDDPSTDTTVRTTEPGEPDEPGTTTTPRPPVRDDGLVVVPTPTAGSVATGEPFVLTLDVRNTTTSPRALSACSWELLPVDRNADQRRPSQGPCQVDQSVRTVRSYEFPTDGLAPGRYVAFARTATPTVTLAEVLVTVLPGDCAGRPDATGRYRGLSETEAEDRAGVDGFRVIWRDGRDLARTDDLRPDRVNAMVEDGVVIGACRF